MIFTSCLFFIEKCIEKSISIDIGELIYEKDYIYTP